MEQTNAQIVSDVINDLRALSIDDRVSERYVLSKLRDKTSTYLKRENDQLRLFRFSSIFTTISCVEMVEANAKECCGEVLLTSCKNFRKSKKKIPEIYSYRNGIIIDTLYSIGGQEYKETTPRDYEKKLKREFINKKTKYFWFNNGHIIIPDSEVELVELSAMFIDGYLARKLSKCISPEEKCILPLQMEFKCPSHLLDIIKKDTVSELFSFYKRSIVDEVPNNNTNQKSSNTDLTP